jgi:Ni,Fe-hydrogenase I large subunit
MTRTVVIDPVTRIEGELALELSVDETSSKVSSAKATASMFRGFETLVLNRDPRDAGPILSAICGVCYCDHHLASVRAVEAAAGMTSYSSDYSTEQTSIPKNAVLGRNLVAGADWAYSHMVHILALAGPDYHLYGLIEALKMNGYADLLRQFVVPAQQYMNQTITLWGGKTPHPRATVPGGIPVRPTADVIGQTKARISSARALTDVIVPIVWNYLTANAAQLNAIGHGPGNFISMGAFPDPTTSGGTGKMPLLIPRGVIKYPGTSPSPFDPSRITEDTSLSWYKQPTPEGVIGEQTPVPDMSSAPAYTWSKAPSYDGMSCESGPLARECVSGIYPKLGSVIHGIVSAVPGLPLSPKGSAFDRMAVEALELLALVGSTNTTRSLQVLGEPLDLSPVDVLDALGLPTLGLLDSWLDQMDVGQPSYDGSYKNPGNAEGIGLWEAPRGSLLHWISIKNSKVANYQVLAPTTWNASPGGPLESALVGTPVGQSGTDDDLRPTAYVVRSFNLCMACAVHAVDARGNDRYLRMG